MSRQTDYKPEFADLARNYALLGATVEDIGPLLGVTGRTIRTWKRKHPEFAEAIEEGNRHADAKVAGALFRNALEGNVVAQIFWMKNRQGWRDRQDMSVAGANGGPLEVQIIRFGEQQNGEGPVTE